MQILMALSLLDVKREKPFHNSYDIVLSSVYTEKFIRYFGFIFIKNFKTLITKINIQSSPLFLLVFEMLAY